MMQPRLLLAATVATTVRSFLLPIARHFRTRGWRVDALASDIEKDDACQSTFDRVWNAKWTRNPLNPGSFVMVDRIRQLASERGYDIVHVHTPVAGFATRCALNRFRREQRLQVIYTAHGFHFHKSGGAVRNSIFESLERRAANWTDLLIVINHEDLKAAKEKEIIRLDRLRFVPGIGVDRSLYSRSSVSDSDLSRLYWELDIPSTTPLLLMVAEFRKNKRHSDAIRAFAQLDRPGVQLLLAGTGPLFEPMKRLVTRLGVSDRVRFLGLRNDVPLLMRASRAVILPSAREGLPRSVLEAMSMCVPVVGSRARGTSELLAQNAGLLFDVGNIDRLTQAMRSIIDDPSAAETMGQNGRLQSAAYDLNTILRMHEEFYEEAITRRRYHNACACDAA